MEVTLVFHLELAESGERVWWVDCPEVPGFYATREHFDEARLVSETTVREILEEQGGSGKAIMFTHVLTDDRGSVLGPTP